MSFFSKLSRANPAAFFKKQIARPVQGIFRKGGAAQQFSDLAGNAGNFLGQAGRVTRRFANNDVAQGAGNLILGADTTKKLTDAALAGSAGLRGAGGLLQTTSELANPSNFRGSAAQIGANAGNVLEKAKKLQSQSQQFFA